MTAASFDIEWHWLALLWLVAAIPAWLGLQALRTGRIHEPDGGYTTRKREPFLYWSGMAAGGFCIACLLVALLGLTARSVGVF